mgnify:FL=1
MTKTYKCGVVSTKNPHGRIEHSYYGKRNVSCGQISIKPFERTNPIAEYIATQHEEALKRLGLQRLEIIS